MAKFEAIHFDMDGVIADTEPLHVAAEQETCVEYKFDIDPKNWGGFKGMTARAIFEFLLAEYGDSSTQTVDELIEFKTNLFLKKTESELKPIDGAIDFLHWARDTYETMTLVTSSNRRVQERIIGQFGLETLFDNVVTGDDIVNGKPDPDPYLLSLKQSNTRAESSLVVEDSISGIRSALAAKCAVLAVPTSHSAAELALARPTYIATYDMAREVVG